MRHDCLSSLLGDGGQMKWNSARWGEKYFVLGQLEQQKQEKNLSYQHNELNKSIKEGPLLYVSICLSFNRFQQSAGPIPLYSSTSGYRSGVGLGGYVANSNHSKKALFFFTFPISCLFEHIVADNSPFIYILFGLFALYVVTPNWHFNKNWKWKKMRQSSTLVIGRAQEFKFTEYLRPYS